MLVAFPEFNRSFKQLRFWLLMNKLLLLYSSTEDVLVASCLGTCCVQMSSKVHLKDYRDERVNRWLWFLCRCSYSAEWFPLGVLLGHSCLVCNILPGLMMLLWMDIINWMWYQSFEWWCMFSASDGGSYAVVNLEIEGTDLSASKEECRCV